jgi:hypothetical protein
MRGKGVKEIIIDRGFWYQIDDLLAIFKIIFDAQKTSEDTESTIAHVSPRWDKMESDLNALSVSIPELKPFLAPNGGFQERRNI